MAASLTNRDPKTAMGTILACADTNSAADNLAEGCERKLIRVVRFGDPAKVRENVRHLCVAALAAKTPEGQDAQRKRNRAEALLAGIKDQLAGIKEHQLRAAKEGGDSECEKRCSVVKDRVAEMQREVAQLRKEADAAMRTAEDFTIANAQVRTPSFICSVYVRYLCRPSSYHKRGV